MPTPNRHIALKSLATLVTNQLEVLVYQKKIHDLHLQFGKSAFNLMQSGQAHRVKPEVLKKAIGSLGFRREDRAAINDLLGSVYSRRHRQLPRKCRSHGRFDSRSFGRS